ncbi:hypothetical protein JOQ06_028977, partial [Pogonophryne albipinna]
MPQERSETPREASAQRAPLVVSLGWSYCPPARRRGATGHPALHATWTVIGTNREILLKDSP